MQIAQGVIHLGKKRQARHAGVVDQDIDMPFGRQGGLGGLPALGRVGDVHLPRRGDQPLGLHGSGRSKNQFVAVPQFHPRPVAGHDPGDPFPVAHGPAGNDGDASVQLSHISSCALGRRLALTCPDRLS